MLKLLCVIYSTLRVDPHNVDIYITHFVTIILIYNTLHVIYNLILTHIDLFGGEQNDFRFLEFYFCRKKAKHSL